MQGLAVRLRVRQPPSHEQARAVWTADMGGGGTVPGGRGRPRRRLWHDVRRRRRKRGIGWLQRGRHIAPALRAQQGTAPAISAMSVFASLPGSESVLLCFYQCFAREGYGPFHWPPTEYPVPPP